MPDRPNKQYPLGRKDEAVEWALRELETAIGGCAEETRARAALDTLRNSFKLVQNSAATDPLTGIANRARFSQVLEERLRPDSGTHAALLFLDLDGFKDVNDQRGHAAGDTLLSEVARRIARSVREHDLVARHGGDEFVVLLENIEAHAVAHSVATRIIEAISSPFEVDGVLVQLGVSIGVAYFPEHSSSGADLVKLADLAMYRAKSHGGCGFAVYGERDEITVSRPPRRSWAWELSTVAPIAPVSPVAPIAAESSGHGAPTVILKNR